MNVQNVIGWIGIASFAMTFLIVSFTEDSPDTVFTNDVAEFLSGPVVIALTVSFLLGMVMLILNED